MRFTLSIDRRRCLRFLCYLLLLTVFYVVCSARGMLFGSHATNINALPFLVAAIAFYEGPYWGAGCGFYAGLLLSISSTTTEGAETLMLSLFGILCGGLLVELMRRGLPAVVVCGSGFYLLRSIISAVYYAMFYSVPFAGVAARSMQTWTLSFFPGVLGYFLVRAIRRRFSEDDL